MKRHAQRLVTFPRLRNTLIFLLGFTPAVASHSAAQQSSADLAPSFAQGSERPGLLPGDSLQILIWLEPDLSGGFVVDEEGVVTLPMLGRLSTSRVPFPELRAQLIGLYQRELRNPSITITPVRRVYVLGEVNFPGLYGLDLTASLANAVALAGGVNRDGDLRKLSLVRDGKKILSSIDPTVDLMSTGIRSGDQILVERRGWLDRNQTFLISTILSATSIVVALLR